MQSPWEPALARFLAELSAVQSETLELLDEKRKLLVAHDTEGLAATAPREQVLLERLQECLRQRESLLGQAAAEGLPATSLKDLAQALPAAERKSLDPALKQANSRTRLLQHHSLTNWLLVQRTLLHLAQMLEIIATGGRLQPTYQLGAPPTASGALVDHAA